ncbi:MAG: class I SAM-dependent methyltransferase [Chloroflexi bacterium]|nr:class I SAM-dependent methyltransferase [Chloroflexota bacterium]
MTADFSFDDRVARLYNRQRAHPPEVSRQIGETIAQQVGPGKQVLEIGVGTGRIAYPIAAAGCKVTGFDISMKMLNETSLNRQSGTTGNITLLRSDMHHMPFRDSGFDAVMAVHVLHLTKDPRRVLEEIARVLAANGVFVQGNDWIDPQSVVGLLRDHLRVLAIKHAPDLLPPSAGVPIQQTLEELGGTEITEHIAAEWTTYVSPEERLLAVEKRIDAESWIIPEHLFDTILHELRDYATSLWSDLNEKQVVTRRFTLKVTRGSW